MEISESNWKTQMKAMDRLNHGRKYQETCERKWASLYKWARKWQVSESGQKGQPRPPQEKPQ